MLEKSTEKIRIWGVVQGVGFRPKVAKIANQLNMKGQVQNVGGLVHIYVTDEKERINHFVKAIEEGIDEPAEIIHITREEVDYVEYDKFTIITSGKGDDEIVMIPPDIAMCESCKKEFDNKEDFRYKHPFISCMLCGPRYTIIEEVPYDRERTTMDKFEMCSVCNKEYTSLEDRRYHAQTISCKTCGPMLIFKDRKENTIVGDENHIEEVINNIKKILIDDGVIAFKTMGGYNLVCDATSKVAEKKLREIKGREKKPFAIMFSSIEKIREIANINKVEEKLLTSKARPILLLEENKSTSHVGAFLPSIGAQYLIFEAVNKPLIFTSCNISSFPIITKDEEMEEFFQKEERIDGLVYNTREILTPVDDSVMRVIDGNPQMIRRSKGYCPTPLYVEGLKDGIFAMGGDLKNGFALTKGEFAYISQFFGDTDNEGVKKLFTETRDKMSNLFGIKTKTIVADKHPLYWTVKEAKEITDKNNLKLELVQHHHSHIASVMAEHSINDKVIGFAFDGTGYGDDGKIWGGEVLLCEKGNFERICHLKYANLLGGDSSAKEAWKSALAYMINSEESNSIEKKDNKFITDNTDKNENEFVADSIDKNEFIVDISHIVDYANRHKTIEQYATESEIALGKAAIKHKINTVESSSMGRLFDGVAAMLGIAGTNEFEGECAIALEDMAKEGLNNTLDKRLNDSSKGIYKIEKNEFKNSEEKARLALDFHNKVSRVILDEAVKNRSKYGVNKVALSGGVFQNKILMDETLRLLRNEKFEVFYNIAVSPNDGGIALGQAYVASFKEDNF